MDGEQLVGAFSDEIAMVPKRLGRIRTQGEGAMTAVTGSKGKVNARSTKASLDEPI